MIVGSYFFGTDRVGRWTTNVLLLIATGCSPPDDVGERETPHFGATSDAESPRPDTPSSAHALVRSDLWEIVAAPHDLFDDRPADVECAPDGFIDEEGSLEISTDLCPYVTARQPSLLDIAAGDEISVEFWHLLLAALEPAQAHAALMIGEHVVFEWRIPIPSEAKAYTESVVADRNAPAGTPVTFHLHNHGYNTWKLNAVTVTAH